MNIRGNRPVTSHHVDFLKEGFLSNGYVPNNLITCRVPTANEISEFYTRKPHNLSVAHAEERAHDVLKVPNAGGHVYVIDGLHRREVVLQLMEDHVYPQDFRLQARLVKAMCPEEDIALSFHLNSTNDYPIKLSACAMVVQCSRYDELINKSEESKLTASEVARRMVQTAGGEHVLSETSMKRMVEARRQVLGVSRKLPISALQYLESLQQSNPQSSESAFTISNLRSVPRLLSDEEALSLLNRMNNFYLTSIPVPKAMPPDNVSKSCFVVRRAIQAIKSFQKLCGFPELPEELKYFAGQMKNTAKHDQALYECYYNGEVLFEDLALECEKKVPGGAEKVMIARKKLSEMEDILGKIKMQDLPVKDRNVNEEGMESKTQGDRKHVEDVNEEGMVSKTQAEQTSCRRRW